MISAAMRPKLAARARLRLDRKTGRTMLLYPERGLELSGTAADILQLCTGEHTVEAIVERLAAKYDGQPRDVIEREVSVFLSSMLDRALVQDSDG
ncbi:MAG: pyrroloquinoline quinone biosynthesis peptide chaperone PqqD [Candidatus Rokuibacteriota bacterium]